MLDLRWSIAAPNSKNFLQFCNENCPPKPNFIAYLTCNTNREPAETTENLVRWHFIHDSIDWCREHNYDINFAVKARHEDPICAKKPTNHTN